MAFYVLFLCHCLMKVMLSLIEKAIKMFSVQSLVEHQTRLCCVQGLGFCESHKHLNS